MIFWWKTGCHSHFYISFIPAYVKGFFLQLFHYFPVRVVFFFFLRILFSMKLSYFPNTKLTVWQRGGKVLKVTIWLLFQRRIWFKRLFLNSRRFWSLKLQYTSFLVIICTISVTIPNIILYYAESYKNNRILKRA